MYNIIIDGFGGDNSPDEVLLGAAMAGSELGVSVTITGSVQKLNERAKALGINLNNIEFAEAPLVMPVSADPAAVLKEYGESSLAAGLKLLAEGRGDAFVSAGSTGALMMGATFIVKRTRGVKRPALGTMIPSSEGYYLLIDAGANHDCRPEMLCQFAIMGSAYFECMFGRRARVGLVNIGAEETKGDELRQSAYCMLSQLDSIEFVGNVEARDVPLGGCDVAVCDGFTGNIMLKLTEGLAAFFSKKLKSMFTASTLTKLAALALKGQITQFKASLDYKEQGGAPLLGLKQPVIKAHGSSDAKAFKNAIRQAARCCEMNLCGNISEGVARLKGEEAKN